MKKKVLATSWHPGGMNAIAPVIQELTKEEKADIVAIAHQFSEKVLKERNIQYRTISDYNLNDVSISSMNRLLETESPNLILTGTSTQDDKNKDVIEQTITLAARQINIASLAVLDFWGSYSERFNDIYSNEKFRFLPAKIAIMDEFAKRDMLEEGFSEEILVITGNPHFDSLESKARNFTEEEKQKIRRQISLESDLLIFYAANAMKHNNLGYWDLDNIHLLKGVLDELPQEKKDKICLVAKLHPRLPEEDLNEIKYYIEHQPNIRLVTDINPQELVLASDLTLTPFSTVGIEAVYMRRPCISIQPGLKGTDYLSVLTKNNIIPFGHTFEDCKSLVKRAIMDREYREGELIEKASGFRTDGKATERVTNLIYEMLK